jgi:hypothetical protein
MLGFLTALSMSSLAFARPSTRVEGRVVHATKGEILLERAIDPSRADDYERLGFRRIHASRQAADKTLFGDHIYVLYLVQTEYSTQLRPANIEGRDVILEVEHDEVGFPLVVHARAK